jgi:phosphocarrier protein HPr
MPERRVVVGSKVGLHARPAALFVQAAARQPVKVTIAKNGKSPVDARSILAVLALDVRGGEEVVLHADESDQAETVLDDLAAVVATDHDAK